MAREIKWRREKVEQRLHPSTAHPNQTSLPSFPTTTFLPTPHIPRPGGGGIIVQARKDLVIKWRRRGKEKGSRQEGGTGGMSWLSVQTIAVMQRLSAHHSGASRAWHRGHYTQLQLLNWCLFTAWEGRDTCHLLVKEPPYYNVISILFNYKPCLLLISSGHRYKLTFTHTHTVMHTDTKRYPHAY